jgi:hypothetical protein
MATAPTLPADCFADAPLVAQDVARGVTACSSPGSVRDVRGAAPERPARGHDGDLRQGHAHRSSRSRSAAPTCSAITNGRITSTIATASSGRCRPGFELEPFAGENFRPDCCGLIVADRYDAAVVRDAPVRALAAARRKAETLRFARRAARRLVGEVDPSEELAF